MLACRFAFQSGVVLGAIGRCVRGWWTSVQLFVRVARWHHTLYRRWTRDARTSAELWEITTQYRARMPEFERWLVGEPLVQPMPQPEPFLAVIAPYLDGTLGVDGRLN